MKYEKNNDTNKEKPKKQHDKPNQYKTNTNSIQPIQKITKNQSKQRENRTNLQSVSNKQKKK